LSTKMQVSRAPIARSTRSATTAESIPPERPQMTCPCSPTLARMSAVDSSMKSARFQSPVHPQIFFRKFPRIHEPCSVWPTSGWNWTPQNLPLLCATAACAVEPVRAIALNSPGAFSTRSPWLIQTTLEAGRPSNSAHDVSNSQLVRPNSRSGDACTLPPRSSAPSWRP
jgi:hypothetical protein